MQKILRGGWVKIVMTCSAVLGLLVLGALSSNYTKLALNVVFTVQGNALDLNAILNGVFPGFVSAVYLIICYVLMEKGVKYNYLIFGSMAASFIGCLIGIF